MLPLLVHDIINSYWSVVKQIDENIQSGYKALLVDRNTSNSYAARTRMHIDFCRYLKCKDFGMKYVPTRIYRFERWVDGTIYVSDAASDDIYFEMDYNDYDSEY